jgi:undecaprenyl pyrophosphate synthase
MRQVQHLLLIPDGSRRHARREFLRDLLHDGSDRFDAAIQWLDRKEASELRERIELFDRSRRDPVCDEDSPDLLDSAMIPVSFDHLLASYLEGVRVMDATVRGILQEGSVSLLSAYGMQVRNLDRSDDEVLAFIIAETDCANRWSVDVDLTQRCSIRFVGDRLALESQRQRPRLADAIDAFLESADRLTTASRGNQLRINILAPYDPAWEIGQAIVGARFDPTRLPIPEPVDLVIRTGCAGRSLTSGALPLQTAYSQFALLRTYFPDCSSHDIAGAIANSLETTRDPGL